MQNSKQLRASLGKDQDFNAACYQLVFYQSRVSVACTCIRSNPEAHAVKRNNLGYEMKDCVPLPGICGSRLADGNTVAHSCRSVVAASTVGSGALAPRHFFSLPMWLLLAIWLLLW